MKIPIQFEEGDVVCLRSNPGRPMTVREVRDNKRREVVCQWLNDSGALQTSIFTSFMLEHFGHPEDTPLLS